MVNVNVLYSGLQSAYTAAIFNVVMSECEETPTLTLSLEVAAEHRRLLNALTTTFSASSYKEICEQTRGYSVKYDK